VVWIDTDLALAPPDDRRARGDVDDAFAIAAVLLSPGPALLGISTVRGNTSARSAARNARALCEAAGRRDVRVVSGDEPGAAAEAIAALPAGTELLALGPLTNVAGALAIDPSLFDRLGAVRMVGGTLSSRGLLPPVWPHEFNLSIDPRAARRVFETPGPRILYVLEAARRLRFGRRELDALAASRSPLLRTLAGGSERWMRRSRLLGRDSFAVWDLVPALDLLGAPGFVRSRRPLAVRLRASLPGRLGYGGLRVSRSAPGQDGARAIEVVTGLDPAILLERWERIILYPERA
jgi:inosine-uridine nucleoside N-ribohydrolase